MSFCSWGRKQAWGKDYSELPPVHVRWEEVEDLKKIITWRCPKIMPKTALSKV